MHSSYFLNVVKKAHLLKFINIFIPIDNVVSAINIYKIPKEIKENNVKFEILKELAGGRYEEVIRLFLLLRMPFDNGWI